METDPMLVFFMVYGAASGTFVPTVTQLIKVQLEKWFKTELTGQFLSYLIAYGVAYVVNWFVGTGFDNTYLVFIAFGGDKAAQMVHGGYKEATKKRKKK